MSPHRARPLLIATGRHPYEVTILATVLAGGIALLLSGTRPGSVTAAMPQLVQWFWLWGLVFAGVVGLIGVFWPGRIDTSLAIEFTAVSALAAATTMYATALFAVSGQKAVGAAIFVIAVAVGSYWRAYQIPRDVRRLDRAQAENRTADISVLLDSSDE